MEKATTAVLCGYHGLFSCVHHSFACSTSLYLCRQTFVAGDEPCAALTRSRPLIVLVDSPSFVLVYSGRNSVHVRPSACLTLRSSYLNVHGILYFAVTKLYSSLQSPSMCAPSAQHSCASNIMVRQLAGMKQRRNSRSRNLPRFCPPPSPPHPPAPSPSSSLIVSFGAATPAPAAGTTSLFGAAPAPAAPAAAPAAGSAFGFGSLTPAAAPSSTSAFGGGFGAPAAAPAPAAGGFFGAAAPAAAAPAGSGFIFGAAPATSAAPAAATGGFGFGVAAPAPATAGTAPAFGAPAAAPGMAGAAGAAQEMTPETRYEQLPEGMRKQIDELAGEIKRQEGIPRAERRGGGYSLRA